MYSETDGSEVTTVLEGRPKSTRQDSSTQTPGIYDTIIRPGAVRINVKGAFIVDEEAASPRSSDEDGAVHEKNDIRLPHHTSVVSHVAVDV